MNKKILFFISFLLVSSYTHASDKKSLRAMAASKRNIPGGISTPPDTIVEVQEDEFKPVPHTRRSSHLSTQSSHARRRTSLFPQQSNFMVRTSDQFVVRTSDQRIVITEEYLNKRLDWYDKVNCGMLIGMAGLTVVTFVSLGLGIMNTVNIEEFH